MEQPLDQASQDASPAVTENSATPVATDTNPVETASSEGAQVEPTASAQPEGQPAAEQQDVRRDTKAERRISKLTHRAKTAEETVQAKQDEITFLQNQLNELKPPSEEDVDYDQGQHTANLIRHATREANVQGQLDAAQRDIARAQQQAEQQLASEVAQRTEEFQAKTPDYSQSVQQLAPLQNLGKSVVQLENAPEVYYALSKDLNLAVALERLPETQRLLALGQLSAEVNVKPVTVSNAPPPVESAQGGSAVSESGPRADMTMAEFNAWYDNRHGAK